MAKSEAQKKKEADKKALDDVLGVLDKMNPYSSYLSESTLSEVPGFIDTGSYSLNAILSGKFKDGGIPKRRLTMLGGESMTGKSYIVQRCIANAQKEGLTPVVFDTENAIDPAGAARLGVDTTTCKYCPTFSIEQCRNMIFKFLTKAKEAGMSDRFFIVIDSLGNLDSETENKRMEKGSTATDMGSRARAMKSLLKTCTQLSALTGTTMLFTNHTYDDPGALHPSIIKTMPGGKAVVYLPSVTVQLARKPVKDNSDENETDETTVAGQKAYAGTILRGLTIKNRFIKQYLQTEMYLSFQSGLQPYFGLLKLAVQLGCIEQTGATYVLDGKKMGYAKNFRNDKDLWENTLLPKMQAAVDDQWAYNGVTDDEAEFLEEEDMELDTDMSEETIG